MKISDYLNNINTFYDSPKSVEQIKYKLEDFDKFIGHKDSDEIAIDDITNYLIFADKRFLHKIETNDYENKGTTDRPRKTISHRTKLATLSAFRQYLMYSKNFELANEILVLRKKFKKIFKRFPVQLTETETKNLLHEAEKIGSTSQEKLTNKYIVFFLIDSGMRRAELCSINPEDIDRKQFDNAIYSHRIKGKGNKPRLIYFHSEVLKFYFKELYPLNTIKNRLFEQINKKSKELKIEPFKPHYVWLLVKKAAKNAKIKRDDIAISPHKLRSTYITAFVKKAGIIRAQEAAGHSSIATTKDYTVAEKPTEKQIPNLTKNLLGEK